MFQYLPYIVNALEALYKNDSNLFEGKTHELTFSYRIALYLSQQLEKNQEGLFIDCEYHRDLDSNMGKKFIRPRTTRLSMATRTNPIRMERRSGSLFHSGPFQQHRNRRIENRRP